MENQNKQLPQFPESYWRDSVRINQFPQYNERITVDVAVIGAGITGITTAYLLIKEGYKVALLDASSILSGTTGHTTAKITAQHGLIYDELINNFGSEQARLYYEANSNAIKQIAQTIDDLEVDCDFKIDDAYIYTNDDEYIEKLANENKAYQQLNIDGGLVKEMPLKELPFKSALQMKNQAQFHPLKYLQALLHYIEENGGLIFERTAATDIRIENNKKIVSLYNDKEIVADAVVQSSHYPFYDGLSFFPTRMYAERSYILAAKTKRSYPGGMYISAEDPPRSLRSAIIDGQEVVLFAGENHKTGQGISTYSHYETMQQFAEDTLGIEQVLYRWSAQDLTTLDKLPYIGQIRKEDDNIFVATGFRKWGMTNGTAAAYLLCDLILKKDNPYADLVTPQRFYKNPNLKNLISTNLDVAKHLIAGKLEYPLRKPEYLVENEGAVVNIDGKRAGAYKDENGRIYALDTTCTHLGCEVEWNDGERTWDCPCHGSRFSITGEIINGPAEKNLERLD